MVNRIVFVGTFMCALMIGCEGAKTVNPTVKLDDLLHCNEEIAIAVKKATILYSEEDNRDGTGGYREWLYVVDVDAPVVSSLQELSTHGAALGVLNHRLSRVSRNAVTKMTRHLVGEFDCKDYQYRVKDMHTDGGRYLLIRGFKQ